MVPYQWYAYNTMRYEYLLACISWKCFLHSLHYLCFWRKYGSGMNFTSMSSGWRTITGWLIHQYLSTISCSCYLCCCWLRVFLLTMGVLQKRSGLTKMMHSWGGCNVGKINLFPPPPIKKPIKSSTSYCCMGKHPPGQIYNEMNKEMIEHRQIILPNHWVMYVLWVVVWGEKGGGGGWPIFFTSMKMLYDFHYVNQQQ